VAVYRSKLACTYESVTAFCDTEFAFFVQELGNGTKIRHVDPSLVHHEILGLDVSVNATSGVHLFNRVKHLDSDVRDDVLEDFHSFLSLLDVVV
jgi:hypothetical protein